MQDVSAKQPQYSQNGQRDNMSVHLVLKTSAKPYRQHQWCQRQQNGGNGSNGGETAGSTRSRGISSSSQWSPNALQ